MSDPSTSSLTQPVPLPADTLAGALNRECHCIWLERDRLEAALLADLAGSGLGERLVANSQSMFAESPVFVTRDQLETMRRVVAAVEQVVRQPDFRAQAFERAPAIAQRDPGATGVFFGFDFHLTAEGPRLIEINTNAGGALLSLYVARAQRACCEPVAALTVGQLDLDHLEQQLRQMFRTEFRLAGREHELMSVAIVDEEPHQQFLAPELELFRRAFELRGISAVVADPRELTLEHGALTCRGQRLDLVYNRLTDFYLESPANQALRAAYQDDLVVLTPHPRAYALYADKRNLTVLSDPERLASWGVDKATIRTLGETVPRTSEVTADNAATLWSKRRELFFKPVTGYGSRGAYDGGKITHGTFEKVVQGGYVAQLRVRPSTRVQLHRGAPKELKVDIRCVVYAGEVQFLGARLYRGQTTNMRTEGGGLATVFTAPSGW